MEDDGYTETSTQRLIQMKRIIDSVKDYKKSGRLLDVGAGSGLLVKQANLAHFKAEGVEPSSWLQKTTIKT